MLPNTIHSPCCSSSVLRLCLALSMGATAGCTDARLQPGEGDPLPRYDDRMDVRVSYCASRDGVVDFPVKVVLVADQSASLQCTDGNDRRVDAYRAVITEVLSQPQGSMAVEKRAWPSGNSPAPPNPLQRSPPCSDLFARKVAK